MLLLNDSYTNYPAIVKSGRPISRTASAYMLDDGLMVLTAVVTLNRFKLQQRGGRWLKLVSGVVLLALGLALLIRPEWLAQG